MQEWVNKNGFDDTKALLDYANALVMHYGEAIGALSCQMYEATAAAQGVTVAAAEIADIPSYGEVAKAVNGAKKVSKKLVSSAVERQVKQIGADTTLKNAQRDNAQFAWVPQGDTCAFCLTLASRGWQYMSKKALNGGHAEHIHANCDCQYAIRFDSTSTVEGYDPDKYKEMYNNAEGKTSQEKINSMRRNIAEQKRVYEHGITNKKIKKQEEYKINRDLIESNEYKQKFNEITGNSAVDDSIHKYAKAGLIHRDGTDREDLYIISGTTGEVLGKNTSSTESFGVSINNSIREAVNNGNGNIIGLHTHPDRTPPTGSDFETAFKRKYMIGVVANSSGEVYVYGSGEKFASGKLIDITIEKYKTAVDSAGKLVYPDEVEAHLAALNQLEKDYGIWYEAR